MVSLMPDITTVSSAIFIDRLCSLFQVDHDRFKYAFWCI